MADDLEIPAEAVAWIEHEARIFFESGGDVYPRPAGLEGAEIHAFYDLAREEARSSASVMMAALARTLAGTKPGEAAPSATPASVAAATAEQGGEAEGLFEQTVGSAEAWPKLAAGLQERGDAADLAGLRAWRREDPQSLQARLMELGMKLGIRQRLLIALEQ